MSETPAYKIVLVAGQEFSVPVATPDADIRQTLVAQGFADVAAAEIKRSKRTVGENQVEVLEFVKKAGTKGLTGPGLADLLRRVPPAPAERRGLLALPPAQRVALGRYLAGQYTIAEAIADPVFGELLHTLERYADEDTSPTTEEEALCQRLDRLPAAAAPAPSGW